MDFNSFFDAIAHTPMAPWLNVLPDQVQAAIAPSVHGDLQRWLDALNAVPGGLARSFDLKSDVVRAGVAADLPADQRQPFRETLKAFCPWRKGPFEIYGEYIDTEWRSDWKWARLAGHISALDGRTVLDVGCGSGYHAWRMCGAGAKLVVGIDPYLLYVLQHQVLRRVLGDLPVHVLPVGIDDLPESLTGFDTVFSMGILYHRRSPLDHLMQLGKLLRPGGEVVLETLIIEGDEGQVLVPEDRYAKMRNVWFLPSVLTLIGWMKRCGFTEIKVADVTPTTVQEQRKTEWMPFESLSDFLDPLHPKRTIEGYSAPVRAILIAKK